MNRIIILLLPLILVVQFIHAQPGPGRTVLYQQELENRGILTFYDLLELTGTWTYSSTDGFTLQHSDNGLAGPGGVYWPVFLNDIPLNINVWDTRNLNMIPVVISQIDSVIVIDEPQLEGGRSMEAGGLFIYTGSRNEGLAAEAGLWTGNRSGDPGPFVYTDRATPNLERLGPIASASASYKTDRFSIGGVVKQFQHPVSDPIQSGRILPLAFGDERFRHPKIELESLFLQGSYSGEHIQNFIQAGHSDADDFLFTDLYGTEIPVNNRWSFISLDGGLELGPATGMRYRLNYNHILVGERENKENRLLRWNQQVTGGQLLVQNRFEFGSIEAGVGYDRYATRDRIGRGNMLTSSLLSAFGSIRVDFNGWLSSYADLKVVKGEKDRPAFKTFFNFVARPADRNRLTAGLTYSERLPEEDNSLWFWVEEKGFGGNALSGYADSDIQSPIRYIRGYLSWSVDLNKWLRAKSKIGISRYLDEYIPSFSLVSLQQRYLETGAFTLRTDLDATELMVPLELVFKTSDKLQGTLLYTWKHQLSGPDHPGQRTPEHHFQTRLSWKPVDTFEMWTKLHVHSKRVWTSVAPLDGETLRTNYSTTDVTYRSVIPARLRWDGGFGKDFWNGRVTAGLKVSNILNRKFREHPLGPVHSFTVFLGSKVKLGRQ